ncbi:tRNA 2-selenouridine(34) synthase MnmH, partial [Rickettsiales bacterium]|nr:tRNA 2-selenouridine(34) synthase MnmH [Rickettsiales bacterium]
LKEFSTIIDVRSPKEFEEDSIPLAKNFFVLNDSERNKVGKIYSKDIFLARKVGAKLITKNISKILENIPPSKSEKILIYCWRGGLRSLSLYLILKNIGYDVCILNKGYKSFRYFINNFFSETIQKYTFNILSGLTGSGKTFFLEEVGKKENIINLEKLAQHKGSLLGNIPNIEQPSQKKFETSLWYELHKMQYTRPIWVESESNKIGKLSIPKNLFKRMIVGNILKLNISLNERTNFILKDYDYFLSKISLIKNAMLFLKKFLTKNEYLDLEKSLSSKQYDIFVKSLLKFHYDKLYKKRTYYLKENEIKEVKLDSVNIKNSEKILKEMNKKYWK